MIFSIEFNIITIIFCIIVGVGYLKQRKEKELLRKENTFLRVIIAERKSLRF